MASRDASNDLTRRSLLAGAVAGAGSLALAPDLLAAARCAQQACAKKPLASGRERLLRSGAFGHGVASGHPTERGVTLWTRVDEIERSGRVRLEVARDADFANVVHAAQVRASSVRDFVARTRVTRGLRPGEQYFYRFATATADSPVGRFRTALPADSREPVRIGFFSCQDYEAGYYNAHSGLAAEDCDLIVCLGDYIYEKSFQDGPADRRDTLGANGDGEVMTLPEYRAKYGLYRRDPLLQAMHAAAPFLAVPDDHEVEDNWAGALPGEAAGDRRGVDFLTRRRNALLAYREWMPFDRVDCPEPNRLYRSIRLGANAELLLTDQRQYRDDQPCGDRAFLPCAQARAPGRTMLGATQKAWLKDRLAASTATWKVIGSQVMFMALDLPLGNPINPDQWDGYAAERTELMRFVLDRGISDVTVITGDIHTFFAGTVTTTGRIGGTPAATEFVGGSITSLGVPESLGLPPEAAQAGTLLTGRLDTQNPHMRFADQVRRGYGVLECRPDELRCTFRGPDTALRRSGAIGTLAELRVARGRPRVEVVRGTPSIPGLLGP